MLRDLRIDQEPDRGREGGSLRGLRQSFDAERPADADLALKNAAGEFGKADELARAAGQDHAPPGLRGEAGVLQPVAHEFQDLLDPRLDDADERATSADGSARRARPRRPAARRRVALVRARRDRRAVQRLEPLGRRRRGS